jgi:hypothetical protein
MRWGSGAGLYLFQTLNEPSSGHSAVSSKKWPAPHPSSPQSVWAKIFAAAHYFMYRLFYGKASCICQPFCLSGRHYTNNVIWDSIMRAMLDAAFVMEPGFSGTLIARTGTLHPGYSSIWSWDGRFVAVVIGGRGHCCSAFHVRKGLPTSPLS